MIIFIAVRDVRYSARICRFGRRCTTPDSDRYTPRSLCRDGGRRRDNGGLCTAIRRRISQRQVAYKQNRRDTQNRQKRSSCYMNRTIGWTVLYKFTKDHAKEGAARFLSGHYTTTE